MPAVGLNRMAGSRERALRVLSADLKRGGRDVTWVAEIDDAPVGALVAYPYREQPARTRRFLAALLRHTPPWRWPELAWQQWRRERRTPGHPGDWLYIPAGWWHVAFARTDSLSISAGAYDEQTWRH